MALTVTEIQQLYTAYLGRPADREGLEYWQDTGISASELRTYLANDEQPEYVELYGDRTREEVITAIYENMFGRAPDEAGLAYWLEGEGAEVPESELQHLFIEAASEEDRAEFNARVAEHEGQIPDPEEPGIPGETFELTEGRDNLTGTENDDTFIADAGQNQNGAISNALATGDRLDGGNGRDKLEASLIQDNEVESGSSLAPRPITQNIEEVYIEALEGSVTLDATRMQNVEEFWSDFSRGDMTFTNVNLNGDNLNITRDVTFGIRDTQSDTDFAAYFDSQSLVRAPEQSSNSQIQIRIADVSTATPDAPLTNVLVALGFELAGEAFTLENISSADGSYQGLVDAITDALAANGLGHLDVSLSTPYNQVTFAGNTVNLPFTAQEILVTDPNGQEFGQVEFTYQAIESVEGGFLVAGNAEEVDPSVSSNLVESNLILDNAGRGSTAGDVVIGGGSNSNLGVEQFNVTVDRSSKIESLNTTPSLNATTGALGLNLQNIVIDSTGAEGSLTIGSTQANLLEIDANAFTGDSLVLGAGTVVPVAISNLAHLDAGSTSADVTFNGIYNGFGRPSDAQAFAINTGSGDDVITANVNGTSTSGSTSASLAINAGGGNNIVIVDSAGANAATVITAGGNDIVNGGGTDLTASTGAGNDAIYAENTGLGAILEINALGTGTDDGATALGVAGGAQFLYGRQIQVTLDDAAAAVAGTTGFESAWIDIVSGGARLTTIEDLNNAILTAINEDPVLSKIATATVDSNNVVTVQYLVDGEQAAGAVRVDLNAPEGANAWADLSTAEQNAIQAAYRAQEGDSSANASTDYNLVGGGFSSVDAEAFSTLSVGTFGAPDEVVTIIVGDEVYTTVTGADAIETGNNVASELVANGITASADATGAVTVASTEAVNAVSDGTTDFAVATGSSLGTDSLDRLGTNVINAGTGNDVIALSSSSTSFTEIIEFDAGSFGTNTIVHFEAGTAADSDVLDFSAWLNNVTSASGSADSEVRIATEVNTGATGDITANEVTVVDFNDLTFSGTVSFDDMTGSNVLAALNAAGGFGVGAADATLVGDVQNSLLLVQNWDGTEGNQGEYKVFQVTSGTDAGTDEFTGATLVGTVDFGEIQAFDAANFA